jgi:hypothetical protein
MREIVRQIRRCGLVLTAAVMALGFVTDVTAHPQRRGRTTVPSRPTNVDSSPMITNLNKALQALGSTDRAYDGHREKAVTHIGAAIRAMELPTAKGKSAAAVAKAAAGKGDSGTSTTSQETSDASLRKARTLLFTVHHQLADKSATSGQLRADANIRTALTELDLALKPSTPAAAPKTKAAPAPAPAAASGTPGK